MINTPAPTKLTCNKPGPRNPHGADRLVSTIPPDGLWVFCQWCKEPHFYTREVVMAAWTHGESVQCEESASSQSAS